MNGNNNQPRYLHQRISGLFQTSNGTSKVKNKWTDVLGGGRLWHDTIARIALRKKLGKEPSIDDLAKFAPPENYTALARDLKDDVNNAFCEGEEVCLVRFSLR